MKHLKRIVCIVSLVTSFVLNAQESDKGIKWTTGLSWEQIKQKAKAENKYIFIDVFTTWCGPCKIMEKTVYVNDTVGTFFNQHFISVKLQMDKTKNDNEYVQSWYKDAEAINKEYVIEGFPTALFFSPQGTIVHKDGGFRPVLDFINMAKLALTPGKVYTDPYIEYKRLVKDYNGGIKHYSRMAYMINTAFKIGDADFAGQLFNDFANYYTNASKTERYTRENIEFWASHLTSTKSRIFEFFRTDGEQINRVMNKKGYSTGVIDKVIMEEIIVPFLKKQDKTGIMARDARVTEIDANNRPEVKSDSIEADWSQLYKILKQKFDPICAERNVLLARVRLYKQHQNFPKAAEYYFIKQAKFPRALMDRFDVLEMNDHAWQIFLNVTDNKLLNSVTEYMARAAKELPTALEVLDTYANLLYKTGRTREAIIWEEKAINVGGLPDWVEGAKKALVAMKKGEPTYVDQGAIWLKK